MWGGERVERGGGSKVCQGKSPPPPPTTLFLQHQACEWLIIQHFFQKQNTRHYTYCTVYKFRRVIISKTYLLTNIIMPFVIHCSYSLIYVYAKCFFIIYLLDASTVHRSPFLLRRIVFHLQEACNNTHGVYSVIVNIRAGHTRHTHGVLCNSKYQSWAHATTHMVDTL